MSESLRPAGAVLPVSLLVSSARLLVERQLGLAWISGEVSGCTRATSGHLYFVLKDSRAQVRCVFFRNKALLAGVELRDGQQVEVRATATIYEARGEFQLNVETVRLAGLGVLYERFAQLKAKLAAAGWFAEARKRPLPPFPRRVGIVTSRRAAALSDVLTTLNRRHAALPVILYPAAVQGQGAAAELAQAIRLANDRAEVDVLIVCRGGGSIEDLWAFNEEVLAHAIFESRIIIVSGVGHETDFTISDFVADLRAATPTAAASLAAPDAAALRGALSALGMRTRRAVLRAVETRMQRLDGAALRLVHPAARLARQAEHLQALRARLRRAAQDDHRTRAGALDVQRRLWLARAVSPLPQQQALAATLGQWERARVAYVERQARKLDTLGANLRHLDPRRVLERGYSIVTREDGSVVVDGSELAANDRVEIAFARGHAGARVTRAGS